MWCLIAACCQVDTHGKVGSWKQRLSFLENFHIQIAIFQSLLLHSRVVLRDLLVQRLLISAIRYMPLPVDIVKVHIGAAISFSCSLAVLHSETHPQRRPNILVKVFDVKVLVTRCCNDLLVVERRAWPDCFKSVSVIRMRSSLYMYVPLTRPVSLSLYHDRQDSFHTVCLTHS